MNNRRAHILLSGSAVLLMILACSAGGQESIPPTQTFAAATETQPPEEPTALPIETEDPPQISTPLPPTAEPQRITFEPGAISATVSGMTNTIGWRDDYVIYALEGQQMTVTVDTEVASVALTIIDPLGVPLLTGTRMTPTAQDYSGILFATGDHTIRVQNNSGSAAYTMTISIPPLDADS